MSDQTDPAGNNAQLPQDHDAPRNRWMLKTTQALGAVATKAQSGWTLKRVAKLGGSSAVVGTVAYLCAKGIIPAGTVLHDIDHFAKTHGPIGVGAGVGVESIGVPFPGEATLIGVAAANHGHALAGLEIGAAAGLAGAVGSAVQFGIAKLGVNELLRHLSDKRQSEIKVARCFFEDGGKWVVSGGRFLPLVRSYTGLVAGMSGMPFKKFMAWNAAGAAAWSGLWGTAGYFTGDAGPRFLKGAVKDVIHTVPAPCLYVVGAAAMVGAGVGLYKFHKTLERWKQVANQRIPGRLEHLPKDFVPLPKIPGADQQKQRRAPLAA